MAEILEERWKKDKNSLSDEQKNNLIRGLISERDCWIYNAQQLQKGYNKLEKLFNESRSEIDNLKVKDFL
jgi:hypothetical protein